MQIAINYCYDKFTSADVLASKQCIAMLEGKEQSKGKKIYKYFSQKIK